MPALKNPRHERFVQIFPRAKLQGLTQGEVYRLAGFTAQSDHSAETMASRLMQRPDIRNRLAEIAQFSVRKAEIDADNLLSKAERIYHQASEDREHGSANKAIELQGKLSGHLIDRVQVEASIEFGGLRTADDVVQMLLAQNGGLDGLRALFDGIIAQAEQLAAAEAKAINGHGAASLPPTEAES